ncbi:nuclear pore protein 84/107 [Microdochium trichocladiopsis]|uniref:Nuclear pore complex protein n=1 Tax=Microdochium trichocladiopsis TaxID=1682393 RepID=A0A9P8Y1J0_9PEZI|nr:nuclear pore protein 84/107 [Microdochium trichocladiopsis]KAH7026356.1 nuclear pore protein 84/107 [Microdochium trichocladiopsis]
MAPPRTRSRKASAAATSAIDSIESDSGDDFAHDAERFAKALDLLSVSRRSPTEKRTEILLLVDTYYQYAAERVHMLRQSLRSSSEHARHRLDDASSQDSMDLDEMEQGADAQDMAQRQQKLKHWELEAQTWDMLRRLLPLRFAHRSEVNKSFRRDSSRFRSTADLWQEFIETDTLAQERKAVLESLQSHADTTKLDIDELVKEYQQRADRGDIIAFGWLHTRSAIKLHKSATGYAGPLDPHASEGSQLLDSNGADPLVTQLDPDVATRQGRKLEPQDAYFERAIWLGCYHLLRRGRSMDEIRDWCVERTEVWRAVSMSAMPLARAGSERTSAQDPLSALLWRRTCFALARQGGTDDHERAVYGILSGDIPSVEKICDDWDDHVFAHYNALLRAQFDAFMMNRCATDATASITQSLPSFNAVQFHGDAASAAERLVSALQTNPKTSAEAGSPIKALQGAIISHKLDQHIFELGLALGQQANEHGPSALIPSFGAPSTHGAATSLSLDNHDGLRLLAHVFLIVSSLEELQGTRLTQSTDRRKAQENVLSAYVSALRLNKLVELIPLYCAKLQGERAFFTLSRNISKVDDTNERQMLLRIMEKLGMDIAKFVVFQPSSLLQQHPLDVETQGPALGRLSIFLSEPPSLKYGRPLKPDFFGELPDQLNDVDEQLIQSLEWFLLVDGLWDEIFHFGTAIYKRFLRSFNLHAARALADRVPCSAIFQRKAGVNVSDDKDISWFEEIRLSASNGVLEDSELNDDDIVTARNFFEMECLVRTLDAMETVASSEGLARESTEEMKLNREFWAQVGESVKQVKSFIQPVLNQWLMESIEVDEDYSGLREAYIPEVVIGYVSVLHFAGTSLSRDNLLECMELAATIARKDADVQDVLMKCGRMKEIVEGFANCSKALAISGGDKKGSGGGSKRMREMGWTRELWTVRR